MSETSDALDVPESSSNDDSDVPDMSTSSKDSHDPATAHQRANEIYNNLMDGRSAASSIVLDTPYGEIRCAIELDELDLRTRWDCVSALPNAMFSAAGEIDEDGNLGDGVELEADIIPGGDGMVLIREVVIEALNAEGLDKHDLRNVIENDLKDPDLIEIGMRLLEMSLDRGEITGFRFED